MENIRGSAGSSQRPAQAHHSSSAAPAPAPAGTGPTQFQPTHAQPKKRKRWPFIIGGLVALLLVALLVAYFLRAGGGPGIDSSKYQAVFFTNGQVYFGKLQLMNNDEYMKLTDIYYLQSQSTGEESDSKNPQQASSGEGGNIQLIKLGEEIHGPQDEMIIVRDQVLFYENIKTDGQVAKKIEEFKKK